MIHQSPSGTGLHDTYNCHGGNFESYLLGALNYDILNGEMDSAVFQEKVIYAHFMEHRTVMLYKTKVVSSCLDHCTVVTWELTRFVWPQKNDIFHYLYK